MKLKITGLAFTFLFTLLFLEVRYNAFDTLSLSNFNKKDIIQNPMSDHWIAGTMLNARVNGFWSAYGFNVRYTENHIPWKKTMNNNIVKYETYKDKDVFPGKFRLYKSALRVPTNAYVILDNLLCDFFNKCSNLSVFITLNSVLFAFVLTLFCYWVALEFGYLSLIFVFIGLITNHWLIRIGQLPNFSLFIRFLPFVIGLFILRYNEQKSKNHKLINMFLYILFLVGLNQMIDYEFTPLVMVSATLPFFYYAIKNNWDKIYFLKIFITASSACILSFIIFFLVHIYLVSLAEGSYDKAIDFFQYSFFKRSIFTKNINLSPSEILCAKASLFDVYFNLMEKKDVIAGFTVKELIIGNISAIVITFGILWSNAKLVAENLKKKYYALNVMLILSFIGSSVTIYIYKSHVACHPKLDYIFWCLPFTLVSTLVIGYSFQIFVQQLKQIYQNNKSGS